MPCRYDESEWEIAQRNKKTREVADNLTRENDMLREAIIGLIERGDLPEPEVVAIIEKNQVKHRKEDLKRLKGVFLREKDAEKLGKVMLADPEKPLTPQLGFDPDVY